MYPTSSYARRSPELRGPSLRRHAAHMVRWAVLSMVLVAACSTSIQHDLSESEANEILVVLQEHGISGEKSRDGRGDRWLVSVPAGDASRSWQLMQARGLPRRPVMGFDETFEDSSLIPTPSEERMRVQRALSGELERSLMAMNDILDARVHLVIPSQDASGPAREEHSPPRASVLLVVRTDGESPPSFNPEIAQRLVAGAVEGLDPQNVIVVVSPGQRQPAASEATLVGLGPFTLTRSSRMPLAIVLGVLVTLNLGLGAGLTIAVMRQKKRRGDQP